MRSLVTLIFLCLSSHAMAEDITYDCRNQNQESTAITFDKSILKGQSPKQATVHFTVEDGRSFSWTTEMYMNLQLNDLKIIFVEFRLEGPWNTVSLEVDADLNAAKASIQFKDENLFLPNLSCLER